MSDATVGWWNAPGAAPPQITSFQGTSTDGGGRRQKGSGKSSGKAAAGRPRQTWRQDPWADAPPQSKKSKRSDEEEPRDEGIDRAVPDGDFDSMSVGSHHSQGAWQKWNNQTHQKNRSTRRGRGYIDKR